MKRTKQSLFLLAQYIGWKCPRLKDISSEFHSRPPGFAYRPTVCSFFRQSCGLGHYPPISQPSGSICLKSGQLEFQTSRKLQLTKTGSPAHPSDSKTRTSLYNFIFTCIFVVVVVLFSLKIKSTMMHGISRLEFSSLQQLKQVGDCVVFSNAIKEETTQEIQVNEALQL